MSVQEHDAGETRRGERRAQIRNHRHERRNADMGQPDEADVRIRQGVIEWRSNHRPDLGGDPARDFLGNQHVGQERAVRAVLLGGPGRNDDGMARLQERLDFGIGHFAEKHRRWFHGLVSLFAMRAAR